jgi:hypothetical protein
MPGAVGLTQAHAWRLVRVVRFVRCVESQIQAKVRGRVDVTIKERKIGFTPTYDIEAPGATYGARKAFFAMNDHLDITHGEQVVATIQGLFSPIRDKHEFRLADGRIYQYECKKLWKPVDTCEGSGESYTIYEHRGLKYSVFRGDLQIAAFEKNRVAWGNGNEYDVRMDADADVLVMSCIVLTINSGDDQNDETVTIDFGNIGPEARPFDESWQPR